MKRTSFVRERVLAMIVIITKMASVELVSKIYTKYAIIVFPLFTLLALPA